MINNEKFTDEEIVEKVRSVDQEFYVVIMERYQNKLLRYAMNITGDEDTAVDVIQESFIKAFINLKSFDLKKKFSSWIYRIVHNEAMNSVKKYLKETPFPDHIDSQSDEDLEDDFKQKETVAKVKKCLKKIPLLYSEPLSLYFIEEKSYEEISDILRIPMGTVAIRINRAKKLMKNICQKN
ncbi:MAG: ECF subfamily RNA polymerase sigma factor, RNA polymerase sigma-70 factor, ECF subfamily [Candidatus Peregrinibacteria bacterium GW2011_GWC2_39_14]|nr:MAG: ECF subfamily RNA polymerase sigma factor, RNA polymerase sigma-70 factor, ECF subfamily [Candidatus Peregrinibacteria bacterium GW2011_GWC2_39_14]